MKSFLDGIPERFLHRWIVDQDNLLDVIRLRFLFWLMVIGLCLVSATFPITWGTEDWRQVVRSGVGLTMYLAMFVYFRRTGNYRVVGHVLHAVTLFLITVNTVFIYQGFNSVTLLILFLNVLFSYFMLGYFWGTVYALVNFLPMMWYLTVLEGGARISLMIEPKEAGATEFLINFTGILVANVYMLFTLVRAFQVSSDRYASMLQQQQVLNRKLSQKEQDLAYANIEMKRANIELKKANQAAEASSKAKSEFLSTMSHEIRTPMNAVIGMTHILLDEQPTEEQRANLNLLKFSAENLLVLINDILDFSKIEAGKVEFEHIHFDLKELIIKITRGMEYKANESNLKLTTQVDDRIKYMLVGDPTRLSQVLTNLLGNALKFTNEGEVVMRVMVVAEDDNYLRLRFEVQDTGIGIPKKKLDKIFDSFSQASSETTRKFGGTGLGLAIVKRLLELQNSQIEVDSILGQGSIFSFELPFGVLSHRPVGDPLTKAKLEQSEVRNLSGKKILLVEDNPSNVLVARKFLERWNATLELADNGAEALDRMRNASFDLVLMDLQMPVMDGYQAATLIRSMEDPIKRKTPIIALTASAMVEIQDRAFAVGMNDYVSKPFNPQELYQKIVRCIANA